MAPDGIIHSPTARAPECRAGAFQPTDWQKIQTRAAAAAAHAVEVDQRLEALASKDSRFGSLAEIGLRRARMTWSIAERELLYNLSPWIRNSLLERLAVSELKAPEYHHMLTLVLKELE